MKQFLEWFQAQNGTLDSESMELADIPGQGKGAIASRDIPVCVLS